MDYHPLPRPNFSSSIREALSFVPGDSFEAEPIDPDWVRVRSQLK